MSKEEVEKIRHALFGAAYTMGGQDYTWLFKHLDKDHNGSLDPREFESCVRKVLKISPAEVTGSQLYKLFAFLDLDGNGTIELSELLHFAHAGAGWQVRT